MLRIIQRDCQRQWPDCHQAETRGSLSGLRLASKKSMVITIVMEAAMNTLADSATDIVTPARHWLVELNIAGYRILRRADKRRHLLGIGRRSGLI